MSYPQISPLQRAQDEYEITQIEELVPGPGQEAEL